MSRHTWRTNVFELDITYRCTLSCPNCTRRCDLLSGVGTDLGLQSIHEVIRQTRSNQHRWNLILLMGGEPTLHPNLLEIVGLLGSIRGPKTRIGIVSNMYTPETRRVLSTLPSWVEVRESPKDGSTRYSTKQGDFWTMNVAPIDFPEFVGFDYSNGCHQQGRCGLAYTANGWFFCSMMVGIARLFKADLAIPSLQFMLSPAIYHAQMDLLCRYCGRVRVGFELGQHKFATPEAEEAFEKNIKEYPLYSDKQILSKTYQDKLRRLWGKSLQFQGKSV